MCNYWHANSYIRGVQKCGCLEIKAMFITNVREYRMVIKNGQSKKTGNIEDKQTKNTTQYVLDTTV
jgi:hypothetical protein